MCIRDSLYTDTYDGSLTEDNNRCEKVEDIIADIRVGMNLSLIHI